MTVINHTSVEAFKACDDMEAVLISEAATGKTTALLDDFVSRVGLGYGPDWNGLFLGYWEEVRNLLQFDGGEEGTRTCVKGGSQHPSHRRTIVWPSGEQLHVDALSDHIDVWPYEGHAYPWIGIDNMQQMTNREYYDRIKCTLRKPLKSPVPLRFRTTIREELMYLPRSDWVRSNYNIED